MALAEEVAAYLGTQLGLTAGHSLYANVLPESTGLALAVFEVPGAAPQQRFGSNPLPAYERPRIEVAVRSTKGSPPSSTGARSKAFAAWKALNSVTDMVLPSTSVAQHAQYLRIEPASSPWFAPRDEQGRYLVCCYYDVMRVPNTSG